MYYENKLDSIKDIFGAKEAVLKDGFLFVDGRRYPVVDDVVIVSEPGEYTEFVKQRLAGAGQVVAGAASEIAGDIQYTFGEEWKNYPGILPEHEKEFNQYFDLVPQQTLEGKRACDLGCGMGRWSYFLSRTAKEIVLVDFSDAIFVARRNLKDAENCLFFMGDLKKLPFREDFADIIFSLGVLHHLPTDCLDEVRKLKRYAPENLIFLYYALDNRPFYFRAALGLVTLLRGLVSRIKNGAFRTAFSVAGTYFIYLPLVWLGKLLKPFGLSSNVPLYDFYKDKSPARIEQDVYDRFFTRIEQRVTRKDILRLKDTFSSVTVSDNLPYWHFLCER